MPKLFKKKDKLLFQVSVLAKAFDGAVQLMLAAVFYLFNYSTLTIAARRIFQEEIAENPDAFIWTFAERAFQDFTAHSQYFWATLLFVHGAIKTILVIGLLRDKRWAYPASIGAFGGFMAYQLFELSQRFSTFLSLVTLVDAIVVLVIFLEYQKVKKS